MRGTEFDHYVSWYGVMRVTTAIAVLLVVGSGPTAGNDPKLLKDVEAKALQARRDIRTGHLVLKSDEAWTTEGTTTRFETTRVLWFTQDRIRVDETRKVVQVLSIRDGREVDITRESPDARRPAVRYVECRNYDGNGSNLKHDDRGEVVTTVGKARPSGRGGILMERVFDPRMLGYTIAPIFNLKEGHRLDERIGSPDRKNVTIKKASLGGEDTWLIEWEIRNGAIPRAWISPSRGYNVVKFFSEGSEGGRPWKYEVVNRLRLYPENVWFIEGYELTVQNPSGSSVHERVAVVDAWFNRAAPLEAFSLRNIGLKPGQTIYNLDTFKSTIFDGDRVNENTAELIAAAAKTATPLAPVPGQINYWLVGVCVVAATGAAGLFYRYISTYRRRSSPA